MSSLDSTAVHPENLSRLRGKAPNADLSVSGEHLSNAARVSFEQDVLLGLSSIPKALPCKYFYDTRGSRLFEAICETPEYYITRTEIALLRQVCPKIAPLVGPRADVLEPGSGAGVKIRTLLDSLDSPRSFIPIDISKSAVAASAAALQKAYPSVEVHPLVADFTRPFRIPERFFERAEDDARKHSKLIFFPGSTISNFTPEDARPFLSGLRSVLAPSDFLFIGVDRIKDRGRLERAYDDAAGVTADFNRNLLFRIQKELDTDIDPSTFVHRAIYNEEFSRIEMHLVSTRKQIVHVCDRPIHFEKGESIHTENSYKYSNEGFSALALSAGFELVRTFSDPENLFSLYLCRVPG